MLKLTHSFRILTTSLAWNTTLCLNLCLLVTSISIFSSSKGSSNGPYSASTVTSSSLTLFCTTPLHTSYLGCISSACLTGFDTYANMRAAIRGYRLPLTFSISSRRLICILVAISSLSFLPMVPSSS